VSDLSFLQALFYEDQSVIKGLQEKMEVFAPYFPQWSEHTSAMHQYVLWTALEAEGLGANLQHYNPIANEKVAKAFGIKDGWELKAQLVFGDPVGTARADLKARETQPLEERIKFVGF
jgi:predicted oxidoreductase (fatty acid repression mutant protein)